jgi:V8-like Glu-specific endopeptidase
MDFREVFSDDELRDEFLDRFDELSPKEVGAGGGANRALETLDSLDSVPTIGGRPSKDAARSAVEHMREGTYRGSDPVLEAIIERFTRPVYLVQDSQFHRPQDFEDSEKIAQRLDAARPVVQPTIPSVGRIDLRNGLMPWVGTGWVVRPGIVATNRHVAEEFAEERDSKGFPFKQYYSAPPVAATLDWHHEFERITESRFRVREVLWMEPRNSVDVALLRIADNGENGEEQPPPLPLLTEPDLRLGMWVSVIGYPGRSPFNNPADQQRIFDGIYEVKRLAPGKVTSLNAAHGLLDHDATTLGGNSGSAVMDLESGGAAAIHFGGIEGQSNHAVQAPRLAEIVKTRAG